MIFTCDCGEERDLIFWLDPRFPRVECLPSRGCQKLPESWRPLVGARISGVSQPDRDRRLLVNLSTETAGETSALTLEYCAFPRPSLVLRDASGEVLVSVGAKPARAAQLMQMSGLDRMLGPAASTVNVFIGNDQLEPYVVRVVESNNAALGNSLSFGARGL